MKYKFVLFDLDGTVTDPFEGIANSIIHALDKFGMDEPDPSRLAAFIGPPLVDSFVKYYGFSHGCALAAIGYYREYYADKGIFECRLYDGIEALLRRLKENGVKVVMATSKPEVFAEKLMKHYGIDDCFYKICGATLTEKRTAKDEVIAYALETAGVTDKADVIMVGDRKFDVDGAKKNGIDSVGVGYGYGNEAEQLAARPTYYARTVAELESILFTA